MSSARTASSSKAWCSIDTALTKPRFALAWIAARSSAGACAVLNLLGIAVRQTLTQSSPVRTATLSGSTLDFAKFWARIVRTAAEQFPPTSESYCKRDMFVCN